MDPLDDSVLRWAEALAIERLHGRHGPLWIAQRLFALATAGDEAGVERSYAIARRFELLLAGSRPDATSL